MHIKHNFKGDIYIYVYIRLEENGVERAPRIKIYYCSGEKNVTVKFRASALTMVKDSPRKSKGGPCSDRNSRAVGTGSGSQRARPAGS